MPPPPLPVSLLTLDAKAFCPFQSTSSGGFRVADHFKESAQRGAHKSLISLTRNRSLCTYFLIIPGLIFVRFALQTSV